MRGDVSQEDMGIKEPQLSEVLQQTQFIIHSAASIELEADIATTLSQNYFGTKVSRWGEWIGERRHITLGRSVE